MSGLETAIRNALERADRTSAEIRARIYQSARQALEAGLRKQEVSDPAVLTLQRQRLEQTIHAIEAEERARLQPAEAPTIRHTDAIRDAVPASHGRREPSVDVLGETREAPAETASAAGDLGGMRAERFDRHAQAPDRRPESVAAAVSPVQPETGVPPRKRRRGFYSRLFVYSVFIAFLGIGAWWVVSSGLLLTAAERDTSVANPPATAQDEDFDGAATDNKQFSGLQTLDPQSGFSDDWIEIFKPSESADIAAGTNAVVEVVSSGEGPSVRITSKSASDDGRISIEIPPAVLQNLAGKKSTIALTLQSASDASTQISIECDFASLGDCGRHRFTVTQEKSEALFQVTFDRSLSPTTPGRLEINSDLDGKGRSVNLFAARILPGQ